MPPKLPPRPCSYPDRIVEENAARARHTPVPLRFDQRPTEPPIPPDDVPRAPPVPRMPTQRGLAPPSEKRPHFSNAPPSHEDNPPLTKPHNRPVDRREPDFELEAEAARDSREVTTESLLREYREQSDARRAATERAESAERELAAIKAEPAPKAPSFGNLQFWMIALGTITAVSAMLGGVLEVIAKLRELDRPVASAAQVIDVRQDLADRDARDAKRDALESKRHKDEDQRARLQGAFMCALGFRAKGLDCDSALRQVDFEAQPLSPNKVHAGPTWKTSSTWPSPPETGE